MKVAIFELLFDDAEVNPRAVYRAGQMISLRVHLKLNEPVKCRAVYVKLSGSSIVHWSETHTTGSGENRRTETRHYRSEEIYLDQKVAIYTPASQGPNAEHHPAGEYIYPVAFQVPPSVPSSFEGDVGRIRYYVKANIDRPWKFDNYTQKFYTVIRDFDLNIRQPHEVGPFSTEEDFDVNCCYCFSCCGKVRVQVALPKKGYVPGEQVFVTGEIRNTSKTNLESVSLQIYQACLYITPSKNRTIPRVTSEIRLEGVEQGKSMQLNHLLPVNPMPSSYIEGCNNIQLHYFFRVTASGGCCLSMNKECCELLIGTIPLWSSFSAPIAPPALPPVMQQPQPQFEQPPLHPTVPPPPSYAECMFGRVTVDKEEGKGFGVDTQWAPSYPYYAMPPGAAGPSAPPLETKEPSPMA